jgi:hypothetical protein
MMRTFSHRARAIVAVLAASLALVTVIGPVAAAEPNPQPVTIVSDMELVGPPHNLGTFDTGRGPTCTSGTVADTRLVWIVGGPDVNPYVLTVNKTFTCDDGSGTFFARLLVRGNGGVETFTWVILGGTGRYHDLFGLGSGSTVPFKGGGGVTNTYTGYLFH